MPPATRKNDDEAAVIRRRNANDFGALLGLNPLDWFKTRRDLSRLNIHPPIEAGIYSGPGHEGVQSIVMSGGYVDDEDYGDIVLYTGVGGQDRSSTKQVTDQSFRNILNASLRKNIKAEYPVRLIRGYRLKSVYAPLTGYRYDGLYNVVKAELVEGKHKKKICRFKLQRIIPPTGPAKIPTRGDVPGPVYIEKEF